MELNQTSPPPTSPLMDIQEKQYQCWTYITDLTIDGVSLLIGLCGLVGNGAVLWLLGFHIQRNPITVYILNLAVADFNFLLFLVTLTLLFMVQNVSCSSVVPMRYVDLLLLASLFCYNLGLYLLTAISIERCVSVLCPLWYHCHRPQRLSGVVCALLWALSITVIATMASLCLLGVYEPCRISLFSMSVLNFVIFAPPMVISNVILFIKVQCGSKRHQPKRLYIVIFLTILFFLFFGVPLSVRNFLWYLDYPIESFHVFFLLACINSSINPFIYFLVGSCRRRCSLVSLQVAFRRVFEERVVTTTST